MTKFTHLEIQSRLENVAQLGDAVRKAALACGFDDRAAFQVELALVEAVTNVVRHAIGDGGEGTVALEIREEEGEIRLALSDQGKAMDAGLFDAPSLPEIDPERGVEAYPEGGMGIALICAAMDDVEYERVDGTNTLRLVKSIPRPVS